MVKHFIKEKRKYKYNLNLPSQKINDMIKFWWIMKLWSLRVTNVGVHITRIILIPIIFMINKREIFIKIKNEFLNSSFSNSMKNEINTLLILKCSMYTSNQPLKKIIETSPLLLRNSIIFILLLISRSVRKAHPIDYPFENNSKESSSIVHPSSRRHGTRLVDKWSREGVPATNIKRYFFFH